MQRRSRTRPPGNSGFWTKGVSNSLPLLSSRPPGPQGKGRIGWFVVFRLILSPGGCQGIQECFHFLCISELLRVIYIPIELSKSGTSQPPYCDGPLSTPAICIQNAALVYTGTHSGSTAPVQVGVLPRQVLTGNTTPIHRRVSPTTLSTLGVPPTLLSTLVHSHPRGSTTQPLVTVGAPPTDLIIHPLAGKVPMDKAP